MIEALLALPSHLRRRLADALDAQLLDLSSSPAAVRATLGLSDDGTEVVMAALREWNRLEISGAAAAAWLGSLEQVATRVVAPDFVWSGSKVPGLYSRDTRQVYEELMSTAIQSIWASTYAYFDGPHAFETLASRMDAVPSLEVTLLLNIERRRGDKTAADHLVRRFADRFWGEDWPGASRPRVYYDPRAVALDGPTSALHAKAVIADEETVFITSANLTEAALDRNIEMGLLLRDRTIAATALSYFRGLIDRGRLLVLPAE